MQVRVVMITLGGRCKPDRGHLQLHGGPGRAINSSPNDLISGAFGCKTASLQAATTQSVIDAQVRRFMHKVLIIDDQLVMRSMFCKILEPEGYDITMAVDGRDGWNKARETDFDLILSDFHMPHINGIELCKKLKASSRHEFTPILIVSTESNALKKQEGRSAGASGWIVKPIKAEVLLPTLKRLI